MRNKWGEVEEQVRFSSLDLLKPNLTPHASHLKKKWIIRLGKKSCTFSSCQKTARKCGACPILLSCTQYLTHLSNYLIIMQFMYPCLNKREMWARSKWGEAEGHVNFSLLDLLILLILLLTWWNNKAYPLSFVSWFFIFEGSRVKIVSIPTYFICKIKKRFFLL